MKKFKVTFRNITGEAGKIPHIKFLRQLAQLGLKDAKDIVDSEQYQHDIEFGRDLTFIISAEQYGMFCFRHATAPDPNFRLLSIEEYVAPRTPIDLSGIQ